jgi:hypothetical protein
LHAAERPIANLHAWYATHHRDTDKRSDPFTMEEFCWFMPPKDQEQQEGPPAKAGAAMLALCERRQVPGFAMGFYDVLATAGEGVTPPTPQALMTADAILLAPVEHVDGWRGLLLAEDSASGQERAFRLAEDPAVVVTLLVPPSPDAAAPAWAAADSWLPTVQSPGSTAPLLELRPGSTGSNPSSSDDPPTTPGPGTDACWHGGSD